MSSVYDEGARASTSKGQQGRDLVGKTPRDTAVRMLAAGLWPIPIRPRGEKFTRGKEEKIAEGKEPWHKAWGAKRHTIDSIGRAFREKPDAGIGVGLGPERGPDESWLIDIEGDGPEAEESRARLFGGEVVITLGWGSARGGHQLLIADRPRLAELLPGLAAHEVKGGPCPGVYHLPGFPGLEIRFGGYHPNGDVKQVHSAFPPTVGTDGKPREWNGVSTITMAPEPLYLAMAQAAAPANPTPPLDLEAEIERKRADNSASGPSQKFPGFPLIDNRAMPTNEDRAVAYLAKCDPAISGQKGHNQAFKAACKIGPGFDLSPETALRLLRDHFNPRCEPPWSDKELQHKVEDAYKVETRRGWFLEKTRNNKTSAVGPKQSKNGDGHQEVPKPSRPAIEVNTERHRVLAETLAALPLDPDLYTRGNVLVRITREQEDVAKLDGGVKLHNAAGMARVVPLGVSVLGCRLTALAEFFSWRTDRSGEAVAVPVHPPGWLLDAVIEHTEYPGVRPLRAIASAPFPRPDGSLVTTPGYDHATGVYLAPGVKLAPIPGRPTQADAQAAAGRLLAPFRQFPFVSDNDRAVLLAAILGAVARPGIRGATPGHAIVANRAGTGKGKLVDCVGIIAHGRPVPTTSYPYDETEATKVKASLAIAVIEIVHLDNLREGRLYGNSGLDSALTSMEVNERILGQSKTTGPIELRPVWFLSGNNVAPGRDAHRRWLVCRLATDLERPEERDDIEIPDLLGHIAAHRAELLHDALVVLHAHKVAGQPSAGWAPLGSFEEWDRVVRRAVWFATGWDCNATRRKAAEDAPERQSHLALIEAWEAMPGCGPTGRGMTALEAYKLAAETTGVVAPYKPKYPDLADAFLAFSKDGRPPGARIIGNVIRAISGCIIGGKSFRKSGEYKGYALWKVEIGPLTRGDSGESNDSDSHSSRASLQNDYNVMAHGLNGKHNGKVRELESPNSPESPSTPCGGCLRLECKECNPDTPGVWEIPVRGTRP